jgi:4-amino-4-deoxy-L-arabinose transferase-like glycosyltransferase
MSTRAAHPAWPWLLATFALALLVRLAWALHLPPTIDFFDGRQYSRLALGLLREHAYLNPKGHPSAFWPPGYPALLAGVYALAGPSVVAVRIVQCVLDAATALVAYALARRVLDARGAVLAALATALYPLYVYSAATFFPASLLVLLLGLVVLLLLVALERRSLAIAALAGLLGGWAALTAASSLPALLACAAWTGAQVACPDRTVRVPGLRIAAVFLLPLTLVVGLWTARNERVFHAPVLVSTNGGYNFWLGNYPGVRAETGNGPETPAMAAEADAIWASPGTEQTRDAAFWRTGAAHVRADVPAFLRLSAAKALHFWSVVPTTVTAARPRAPIEALASWLSYGLLLPFAIAWLLRTLPRDPVARLVLLLALVYTAEHALVLSKVRFRLPLDLFVIVYGCGGLVAAWDAARGRSRAT